MLLKALSSDIILLVTPILAAIPYTSSFVDDVKTGYIKAYLPGVRENGGQYTHSSVWVVIAEAILGQGDKAGEFYRMINPIEHARTKEAAKKYKVEPYVIAADIYGAGT